MTGSKRSPMDEAVQHQLGGSDTEALRIATTLLRTTPPRVDAAVVVVEILREDLSAETVSGAVNRLVDAFVRRGDLPGATAVALSATTPPADRSELVARIAKVFSSDSAQLVDQPPSPPPLPTEFKLDADVAELEGEALRERAAQSLRAFVGTADEIPAGGPVPRLPLFGALSESALARLLLTLEAQDLPSGQELVRQGDDGHAAFVLVRGQLEALRRAEQGEPVRLALLTPGTVFGEMALVSGGPRAASVVAVEASRVLVIGREALEKHAREEPAIGEQLSTFCRQRMLSNLARQSAILGAVAPEIRGQIMARFATRSFEAGQALVRAGEETGGLFLIASGEVDVSRPDPDGDRLRLARLGPGEVVGEISLVLRRPATADVVAVHPTVALELSRDEFQRLIRGEPAVLSELYELATKREEETRTVVAQEALSVDDAVLL